MLIPYSEFLFLSIKHCYHATFQARFVTSWFRYIYFSESVVWNLSLFFCLFVCLLLGFCGGVLWIVKEFKKKKKKGGEEEEERRQYRELFLNECDQWTGTSNRFLVAERSCATKRITETDVLSQLHGQPHGDPSFTSNLLHHSVTVYRYRANKGFYLNTA